MRFYSIFKKESDPFLKKSKWLIILFCISSVISILIYSRFLPSNCETFISDNFNGVVIKKYIDPKNHNLMTISLRQEGKRTIEKTLEYHDTIVFEKLKINDTLMKLSNQNYYLINLTDTVIHVCND